jgi:hypothetical protein
VGATHVALRLAEARDVIAKKYLADFATIPDTPAPLAPATT